ncbi:MAG: hypothetical protein ACLTR8_16550 [Oscillospiraceae bacterium]
MYTFSMDCQCDSQGNLTFAVTAPETITGITGKVSDAGGKLTFDDTALQFDLMAEEQVTPRQRPVDTHENLAKRLYHLRRDGRRASAADH